MSKKVYFAKIISFQRSLAPGEVWTDEKLNLYREIPVKPSNEVAMWGFIRYMTKQMFAHDKKKYLREKVNIPIAVVQMAEKKFEEMLYPVWDELDIKETDLSEIVKVNNTNEIKIPDSVLEIFNKQLDKAKPAIEVGRRSTEDKLILPESLVVDMYAGELAKFFRSYREFLDYLFEEGKIASIIVDENKERHMVISL